ADQRPQALLDAAQRPLSAERARPAVEAAVINRDLVLARSAVEDWPIDPARPMSRPEHDLWEGVIDFEDGNRRQAIRSVCAVVADAGCEGYERVLLEAGRPGLRLLRAVSQV